MEHTDTLVPADLAAALPRLRRYARVLVGGPDGADELVERTLAGALRGNPPRRGGLDLVTWLFALMHAAHRREAPREAQQPAAATADLCTRVLRLPIDEREVLMLVAVERLAYGDIARLLGTSVATVMSTLARARDRLRTMEFNGNPGVPPGR
jgi:RNA polymerase sigma-70 factor (ECF subfamily)